MSQELQVVQCFSCQTFQTQICKKSKKWICKICNEKQSLKKVYAQGSGKDCRIHCQQLNDLMSKKHAKAKTVALLEDSCSKDFEIKEETTMTMSAGGSKWAKYLSQPSNSDSDDDGEVIRPSQFVLPQCTPESIEIPLAKKFKNDFEESQVKDTNNIESFFSNDDNIFNNVSFLDVDKSTPPLCFNPEKKSSQEVTIKSKDKINEKRNNGDKIPKMNFDMFMDDLIEDKDEEINFDDTNSGKCDVSTGSKFENKRGNGLELNEAVKSYKTIVKQPQVKKHALFKMVPSDELAIEQLKRKVSLLEDINSYTLEQLTEMCKF